MADFPKVLIVEDNEKAQAAYKDFFEGEPFAILQAYDKDQARLLFKNNPHIGVIVMDGCLGGHKPNTPELIKEFREAGFSGLMIVAAAFDDYNQELLKAGCDIGISKIEPGRWLKITKAINDYLAR